MPVWVVLVFGLIGHPGVQQERLLDDPSTLSFCAVAGQQEASLWLAEHPSWELLRVRCAPGRLPPSINKGEI